MDKPDDLSYIHVILIAWHTFTLHMEQYLYIQGISMYIARVMYISVSQQCASIRPFSILPETPGPFFALHYGVHLSVCSS